MIFFALISNGLGLDWGHCPILMKLDGFFYLFRPILGGLGHWLILMKLFLLDLCRPILDRNQLHHIAITTTCQTSGKHVFIMCASFIMNHVGLLYN